MTKEPIDFVSNAGMILETLNKGIFMTTCANGRTDCMAIQWGTMGFLWGKPVFVCYVRESRFTREMLDANPEFTVNIPIGDYDRKIMAVCGGKSGRDTDKIAELGLTLVEGDKVKVPGIVELPLTMECKVLYRQKQDVTLIPEDCRKMFYPRKAVPGTHDSEDDEHITFIGEILSVYRIRNN